MMADGFHCQCGQGLIFLNVCKDNIIAVSTVTFLIYNTTPRLEDEYFTEPLYILIDCENQK